MIDPVRRNFLLAQEDDALRLAAESDILSVEPLGSRPHERYVLRLAARIVVTSPDGPRVVAGESAVGVWFPSDYLHHAVAPRVLTWLAPDNIWHPNVRGPFLCLGTLRPGTPLTELCYRVFAVIGYQNYGLNEPLNADAAAWARRNLHRFPVDARPLKRRITGFTTQVFEKGGVA